MDMTYDEYTAFTEHLLAQNDEKGKQMQTYTVIWRDNGDDFMFTEVETADELLDLSNDDWVQTAAAIEYADWDEADRIAAMAGLKAYGYEMLSVVKGKLEYVA